MFRPSLIYMNTRFLKGQIVCTSEVDIIFTECERHRFQLSGC
jgi:hypothetical protein